MKKIIILLLSGILIFGGCKDQLKEEVYGALSDLNTVETINSATVGIYQAVENGGGIFHLNAFFPMVETGHRYSSFGSNNENLGNRDFYKTFQSQYGCSQYHLGFLVSHGQSCQ